MPLKDEEWLIVGLSNTAMEEKNQYSVLSEVFFFKRWLYPKLSSVAT